MSDKYQEVFIVIIAAIILFLTLIGIVVFILLYYQKKKFQHRHQIGEMEKKFQGELLKTTLEIQEQTFNSISQEIHDNVGQTLSLAKVQLNIIEQKQAENGLLADVKENISKAITDLRDMARGLSSERTQLLSLVQTVSYEIQRINRIGFLQSAMFINGDEHELPEQKKLILFRIIQESLQNIIRHAKADFIKVTFRYETTGLEIAIEDNGQGFDVDVAMNKSNGLGLHNIITRAKLIGGFAVISSIISKGTTIKINIGYD